jgi:hypothetical protein
MINQISQTHPCQGRCKRFNGEQCNTCMIPMPEFSQRPVCVETEAPELFESLHCSPRSRVEQEPTATEAIMEFMRFPGNAQPYCAACTRKDSDLCLLKMLHAEDKYALELKIMLRNIIIGVLLIIVTVLAVALVGAL